MLFDDCLVKAEVARRATYADDPLARSALPFTVGGRPVLKLARGDVQRDNLGLAGFEMDSIEGDEGADRELDTVRDVVGSTEVDLRYFIGFHGAGVLDGDGDVEAVVRGRIDMEV